MSKHHRDIVGQTNNCAWYWNELGSDYLSIDRSIYLSIVYHSIIDALHKHLSDLRSWRIMITRIVEEKRRDRFVQRTDQSDSTITDVTLGSKFQLMTLINHHFLLQTHQIGAQYYSCRSFSQMCIPIMPVVVTECFAAIHDCLVVADHSPLKPINSILQTPEALVYYIIRLGDLALVVRYY